jgi:hypothetical protein
MTCATRPLRDAQSFGGPSTGARMLNVHTRTALTLAINAA